MKKYILSIALILITFIVFGSQEYIVSMPSDPSAGDRFEIEFQDLVIAVRYIPSGSFLMGSPEVEADREDDEKQFNVTISSGFWMMETEVTQEIYKAVMGDNPSDITRGIGPDHPVNMISYDSAVKFCEKLSMKTGMNWTLPTEAEWEYACRAGTKTPFHYGSSLDSTMANFNGNYPYGDAEKAVYREKTVPVRSFEPNAWGLYDMHGNVIEWCADFYDAEYNYNNSPAIDPKGPPSGYTRILRGGSWDMLGRSNRSAARIHNFPDTENDDCGFRAVLRVE